MKKITLLCFTGYPLSVMLANFSMYNFPYSDIICFALFMIVAILAAISTSSAFNFRKKSCLLWTFGWLFIYFFTFILNRYLAYSKFLFYIYGIFFLGLRKDNQIKIINSFINFLAFLLPFSVIEYILYFVFDYGIVLGDITRNAFNGSQYYFKQLIFNVVDDFTLYPRFSGLTEEPGLIGTLCGFLLFYTDKAKSMRKQFYVFLISGIVSLSLAYYIILVFFLLTKITSFAKLFAGLIVGSVLIGTMYKLNSDAFELLIVERIGDNDIESIDNRSSSTFDFYFEQSVSSGSIIFGNGHLPQALSSPKENGRDEGGIAGAKKWIYQYGLVAFLIVFVMYLVIYKFNKNIILEKIKWEDIVFLVIFWISFYQRETIIYPYTLLAYVGISLIRKSKVKGGSNKTNMNYMSEINKR